MEFESICKKSYKVQFNDQKTALRIARLLGRRKGIKFYVYKCHHCGCWHLTRRSPKEFATLKEISYGR
ncbi:MAG: hypothetical protein KatS3mg072_1094 [Meiothermus sp.]|nr:MAG: hypothetical protein KatS3mg072_1094 [Meiothermus sp.]GIW36263.1 MAG: hypothetical protein KatS3mg073_0408 [Meiothermus sp.]